MVDRGQGRGKYVSGAEGAPPVPPPGGYRRAQRPATPFAGVLAARPAQVVPEKSTPDTLSTIALFSAGGFALVLLVMLGFGATDGIYGTTLLVLQLVVLGVVIAALVTRRGRRWGMLALSVVLVFNVATVGALSALRTSAAGSYAEGKSEAELHELEYPGIKGVPRSTILAGASLEDARQDAEAFLAAVQEELTQEFGFTWVEASPEVTRYERNGYGGESLVQRYTAPVWATNEPIQDTATKTEVMEVIEDVAVRYNFSGLVSINDPANGIYSDDVLTKFYGSADINTQYTWEWYGGNYSGPLRLYAEIDDTSKDQAGDFTASRQKQHERTGEPIEGLRLTVYGASLLSDADRAEFEERIEDYPGYD